MKLPKSLIVLIGVLAICFLQNLVGLATGDLMNADVYYLPLLDLKLGNLEQPIVDNIIKTNAELAFHQHIFWLVMHAFALGLSLLVLRKVRMSKPL